MKRTIRFLIAASLWAWPVAAGAGAVEDFGAVVGVCKIEDSGACGRAVWSFVDITGDDRLTPAELSRLLRVASEWAVAEQIGLRDAVGNLGFGGVAVDENMGRAGAVAMAFLSGPFTARLVLDNFDYDGNGMLERGEVFADSDEKAFVDALKSQMEKLPQYAAMAMMAAMAAQEEATGGGDSGATMMMTPEPAPPAPAPEPAPEAAVSVPEPTPEPVIEQPSFVLRNVDTMVMADGASEVVIISGEIVNQSGDTLAAPDAIAQALDDNSRVLKTWRLAPQRGELGPHESTAFIGRLDDAPVGAVNWSVVLAGGE